MACNLICNQLLGAAGDTRETMLRNHRLIRLNMPHNGRSGIDSFITEHSLKHGIVWSGKD